MIASGIITRALAVEKGVLSPACRALAREFGCGFATHGFVASEASALKLAPSLFFLGDGWVVALMGGRRATAIREVAAQVVYRGLWATCANRHRSRIERNRDGARHLTAAAAAAAGAVGLATGMLFQRWRDRRARAFDRAARSIVENMPTHSWSQDAAGDFTERAALAWTEALTRLAETHAPDEDYAALKANFTDEEQVALTYAIGVINVWNRLQVGFRSTHP